MIVIQFRQARLEDAPSIADLVNSAYRGESSRSGWTTEDGLLGGQRTDPEKLRELIADPNQRLRLAFDDDRLVGSYQLEKDGDRVFLGMLTVDPQLQAQGLGRLLIADGEETAQHEWSVRRLHMTVISLRAELIAYYERRGFHPTGEKKEFPFHDPRFGLPKRQDFHLMILEKTLDQSSERTPRETTSSPS